MQIAPGGIGHAFDLFKHGKKQKAYSIFLWHAKNGNARAQYAVGTYYRQGLGGVKDANLFKVWTWISARNGNPRAQLQLGLVYRNGGDLVPGSDVEAKKWLAAAAKQGNNEAANWLGVIAMHPFDKGVEATPQEASKLFRLAAEEGSAHAMTNLGDLYSAGKGVTEDKELAIRYYSAAAQQGHVVARTRLFEKFGIVFGEAESKQKKVSAVPQRRAKLPIGAKKKTIPQVAVALQKPRTLPPSPIDIYARLSPSVMRIFAGSSTKLTGDISQGSAVAVSSWLAFTNCHVLENQNFFATKIGGKFARLRSAAGDKARDICVVRADRKLKPVAATRPYKELKIGEKVYAIGSPKGLENTISEGIISGLRTIKGVRHVQTSAPIASGSSGGGLFDSEGRLIGITTFVLKGSGNLNFAVSVDEALTVLARARKK